MLYPEIIKNIQKSLTLTVEEQQFFTSLLRQKSIRKKDYLLRIGEICRHDSFIVKGCFKVCYNDEKGVERIIKFTPENWWVVDLDSFLHSKPGFYYIQALEDSEVLQLHKSDYDHLHVKIPAFQQYSNERWQQGFIALQQRVLQSQSMTADERFEQFCQKYPGLEQRIPQKLIAAYLGITPEFLSMLRKKRATRFS